MTLVAPPGDQLTLLIGYDRSGVSDATLGWIAERLNEILTAVTVTEDVRAAVFLDRPVAAEASEPDLRGSTLADWGTTVDPAAPAVTAEGVTIDFREFDSRANRLARWFVSRGIGPEMVVAVAIPRTIDAVVTAHAICRAGGVYLPVDPDQPAQRIEKILQTAAPALVLRTLDDIDTGGFPDSGLTDADRLTPLRSANTAYLLFTSGSTGVPKGVSVPHAAIVNTFEWLQRECRFGPGDTVLYRTPPIFDAAMVELFLPLHVGARIVLTRPGGHRDPFYQAQLMRAERVTAIQMTPSMLTVLAEEADLSGCTDLRCVYIGGEALPPATAHRMRALTGAVVYNLYGPTEAAVNITYHETVDADTRSVPIGVPAAGSGVHVLDDRLRPVPVGTIGDLYLTGIQLASGYRSRPDLTAGAFVADPFGARSGGAGGERMYRTGDLVKWTPAGELDYVGRSDSQVKLRGQRIELGDIESALLACVGVALAVVLLREDTPGDQRLVAYLVARSGVELDTEAVREQLRTALPAYMIPAAFLLLVHIPRTASGKIDRKALPAPDSAAPEPMITTVMRDAGPLDAVRETMAAVLSIPEIDVDADFFAEGGHSLIAVRLIGRLVRAGFAVVLDDVFAAPTPRALASRIGTAETGTARPADGLAALGRRLDPVLELRTGGSATPLFCVHQIGGTAWKYAPLARLLRVDRPIVGLQLPSLTDRDFHVRTLDDLARYYLTAIRRIQPQGPYHLLGYSLGGNIAHAMAAILEAEGEPVGYVGLLDSYPLSNLTDRAAQSLANPTGLDALLPEMAEYSPELSVAVRTAATALLRMVTESESPRYSGTMVLYSGDTGAEPERVAAQMTGWQAAGARLTVRRLPYSHNDIATIGLIEVAALLDVDPALRT